jgi:hypothetical protein|nr:hypothetical protein [uncultured Steroidobacter sp.]
MFPSGRAGIALLVLRMSVAAALLLGAVVGSHALLWTAASGSLAALLFAGFATPLCAGICSVVAGMVAFRATGDSALCPTLFALTSLALALLGPGAYSLDARLFGRRRIVFTSRDKSRNPINM